MISKLKIVRAIIILFVTMPIWFYLLYSILTKIEASDLQLFLFWVYIPFSCFIFIINRIIKDD